MHVQGLQDSGEHVSPLSGETIPLQTARERKCLAQCVHSKLTLLRSSYRCRQPWSASPNHMLALCIADCRDLATVQSNHMQLT